MPIQLIWAGIADKRQIDDESVPYLDYYNRFDISTPQRQRVVRGCDAFTLMGENGCYEDMLSHKYFCGFSVNDNDIDAGGDIVHRESLSR